MLDIEQVQTIISKQSVPSVPEVFKEQFKKDIKNLSSHLIMYAQGTIEEPPKRNINNLIDLYTEACTIALNKKFPKRDSKRISKNTFTNLVEVIMSEEA